MIQIFILHKQLEHPFRKIFKSLGCSEVKNYRKSWKKLKFRLQGKVLKAERKLQNKQ